ncbi:hypothetical protein [Spiroplasma endosymbiont of Virgichneumon dumeticola]
MNSFNFIVSSTSTCGEKSDYLLHTKLNHLHINISYLKNTL